MPSLDAGGSRRPGARPGSGKSHRCKSGRTPEWYHARATSGKACRVAYGTGGTMATENGLCTPLVIRTLGVDVLVNGGVNTATSFVGFG
jgi:hypothetical protein